VALPLELRAAVQCRYGLTQAQIEEAAAALEDIKASMATAADFNISLMGESALHFLHSFIWNGLFPCRGTLLVQALVCPANPAQLHMSPPLSRHFQDCLCDLFAWRVEGEREEKDKGVGKITMEQCLALLYWCFFQRSLD
jgi:hypothetical protein